MKNNSNKAWSSLLGRIGELVSSYKLALNYIQKAETITAVEVNKVLAFAAI